VAPHLAIMRSIAPLLAFFGLILTLESINSLTYAYVLGTGIGTIATILFLHAFWKHLLNGFSWSHAKTILTSAWPFALSSLLGSIMISTDIFILGFLRSAEEVGYYSVADRIMQILYAPSLILATSTLLVFSRLAIQGGGNATKMLRYIFKRIFVFLTPASIVGITLAPVVIVYFFGADYEAAVMPLQILLLTLIFRHASVILGNFVFAHNQQNLFISYTILGVFLNISFDLLLIPRFGIVGSAWATLISQVVISFYLWKKTKYLRQVS